MRQVIRMQIQNTDKVPAADRSYEVCALYQVRELTVNLLYQMHYLVKDVQRHRGISMGLLAGNRVLEGDLSELQCQVARRLEVIHAFAGMTDGVFNQRDRDSVQFAWGTIRDNWQDDKLSENFELHSYFIEQLFHVSSMLAKSIEVPMLNSLDECMGGDAFSVGEVSRHTKQVELVSFACVALPTMIETIAKIRGLASFSAAVGRAEYEHDRKLRFLLQCAREQNEMIHQRAQRLHEVLKGDFNIKYVIGELEIKFVHLMALVDKDVLSGKAIHSSSSQLFGLATSIVDRYWGIVDDGLGILRRWQIDDVESWISG